MSEFKDMQMDLAASLWLKPCSFDELFERKVLNNISEYSFNVILNQAKHKGYIYEKLGVLYCYKKTVKNILNPGGYDLCVEKEYKSEFRKAFEKQMKKL